MQVEVREVERNPLLRFLLGRKSTLTLRYSVGSSHEWKFMDIIELDPRELKPYALNPKLHPPEQVEKIIRSITLTGFDQPIVANQEGDSLVVIKGHGRLQAALEMGLKSVPVLVVTVPKTIADQARLMDNKSAESDYDLEKLLTELEKFSSDELLDTGYSETDVENLLNQLEKQVGISLNDEPSDPPAENKQGTSKEIDPDDFEFNCKCPKCGFEFNND